MAFKLFNLIDAHFQRSNLFHHLPVFDEIYYQGNPQEKVQQYKAVREGQECRVLAVTLIRKEEDILWASARDLLERSAREAAFRVQGIYSFDLLTFDVHRESNTFHDGEMTQLIVNHSLKTKPGEQRLVKYLSAFGLLQKMVDEPWGKIIFKSSVEVFNDTPKFFYALIKRLLKSTEFSRDPVIILVNDLSMTPVYSPQDEIQQAALKKLLDAQANTCIDFLPEVYVQDRNGVRELMSGTDVFVPERD